MAKTCPVAASGCTPRVYFKRRAVRRWGSSQSRHLPDPFGWAALLRQPPRDERCARVTSPLSPQGSAKPPVLFLSCRDTSDPRLAHASLPWMMPAGSQRSRGALPACILRQLCALLEFWHHARAWRDGAGERARCRAAAPRAGTASARRGFVVGGSALIFVLITRNLKDFVILQALCQAFLSWQHAERPGGTAAGRDDESLVPQSFLSRCSLTLC